MKKITIKSLVIGGCLAMFAISVQAQTPIVTPVGVTARLANQLMVTKVTDVDFGGIFIPKTNPVVVSMDYTGLVSVTSGTTSLYSTNLQKQGQLRIDADRTATFTVEYPATVNLSYLTNNLVYTPKLYSITGTAMTSSNTTSYDINADEAGVGSGFNKILNVAGDLAIPETSVPGTYTGTVNVTVTWQ